MVIDPELLRASSVFSALDADELTALAKHAQLTEHEAGDVLTEQGAVGYRFHLFLSGEAVVERNGEKVGTVPAGEFLGEIALLGGGRSTATVRCTEPTRCLTLEREEFWSTLQAEPGIALRILEVVCRRLEAERSPTGNFAPST